MDSDRLWDLFVAVFGIVVGEMFRAAREQAREKASEKAGKHFRKRP